MSQTPLVQLLRRAFRHPRYLALTSGFGVLGFLLAFVIPWIIGEAVDQVIAPRVPSPVEQRTYYLVFLVEIALVTAVLHAVVVYGRGHFNVHLGNRIVTDLRRDLFDHLQRLSLRFYAKERTGSIVSRLLHDVHGATAIIYGGIIVVALDVAQLCIAVVLLIGISWKLTVACALLFPLYGLAFVLLNPRVRVASERLHQHFCHISGNVQEQLSGMALIKSYAAEPREAERFNRDMEEHHGLVVKQSHEGHLVASVGEILVHTGTVIVVGYGGWLALQGEVTAGMLTRFLGYVGIMYGPVRRFAELNIVYQSSLSAMRRVFKVFDIEPAIVDGPHARAEPPRHGEVRFEHVRFRYTDDSDEVRVNLEDDSRDFMRARPEDRWVLEDISFHVRPGERVALVGPSGAGKTTLACLLPRLYDVNQGRILVDGMDVRDYAVRALRGGMAVVQQDSFVFTGTIADNIRYGRPDATMEELVDAARAANAHDFIMAFPDGYQTRLGERGVNLSGGQRQRVSIARALLKDPRILILDEATSALDTESEAQVQRALDVLMRGRTCLIIAHRLSTVRNADRILVLDHGRIVESGSHDALIALDGVYARLVRNQSMLLVDRTPSAA